MENENVYERLLLKMHYLSPPQLSLAIKNYLKKKAGGCDDSFPEFLITSGALSDEQHQKILSHLPTKVHTTPDEHFVLKYPGRFGRFEILSQIAAGGMGVVYKALDGDCDRIVALKVLHSMEKADPSTIKRFRREAGLASKLNHPNIVKVREFGRHDGIYFLVMDFIDGKPLSLYQSRKINECLQICLQIGHGLECIHKMGIIHRDIKPANILLDMASGAPIPKITDFSLAFMENALESRITQDGTAVGTPYYMSPEQAMGKRDVDLRSDIYSLGVVIYELITGKLPFHANTITDLYSKIMNEQPIPPSSLRRTVRKEMDLIISKVMAKDPAYRYQKCRELQRDLKAYLKKKKPRYCQEKGLWGRMQRCGLLNKSNIIIAMLSALLLFTFSAIVVLLARDVPPTRQSFVPTLQEHIEKAMSALKDKNYDLALEHIVRARKLAPNSESLRKADCRFRAALADPRVRKSIMRNIRELYLAKEREKITRQLNLLDESGWDRNKALLLFRQLERIDTRNPGIWPRIYELQNLPLAYFIAIAKISTTDSLFRAVLAMHLYRFKEAWELLRSVRKETPLVLYFKAKSCALVGDWQRGRDKLRRAVLQLPDPPCSQIPDFYYLGGKDFAGLHNRIYECKKKPETPECLLVQVLGTMLLEKLRNKSKRDYREAGKACNILASRYKVPGAYLYLAFFQKEQGQKVLALKNLERALKAGASPVSVLCCKAKLKKNAQTIKALKQAVEKNPDLASACLAMGQLCSKPEEALNYYKKAANLEPGSARTQSWLGLIYGILQKKQFAIEALDKAIDLYHSGDSSPHVLNSEGTNVAIAYLSRGMYLEEQGKSAQALRDYRIAMCISHYYWSTALESLLDYYIKRKQYCRGIWEAFCACPQKTVYEKKIGNLSLSALEKKALKRVKKRIAGETDREKLALLYVQCAQVYLVLKKSERVKKCIEKSLELHPLAECYLVRAEYHYHSNRDYEAFEDYRTVLKMDPGNYRAFYGWLRSYPAQKKQVTFQEFCLVRRQISLALQSHPEFKYHDMFFFYANKNLALFAKFEETSLRKAVFSYWRELILANKSNALHCRTKACLCCADGYLEMKNYDQAAVLYEKAVRFSPNNAESYWRQGHFYKEIGRLEKALANYRMALFLLGGKSAVTADEYQNVAREMQDIERQIGAK